MSPVGANHAHADHAHFDEWDAAYVLGALSPSERREFETHLEECERCRAAVAELGALPGLLGRLGEARAFALLEEPGDETPLLGPPADLVERIERSDRSRRRRSRLAVLGGLAAAAAIAAVLALVIPSIVAPDATPAVAAELAAADDGVPVQASVELTPFGWGTRIDMECAYHPGAAGADGPYGPVEYAMWVVDRDGAETALSTWMAAPEGTVAVSAGTALALNEIAEIEVRSADGGTVLTAEL